MMKTLMHRRMKVIACAVIIEELLPLLPDGISYETLDFGLHLNPQNLRTILQEKINQASSNVDVLLLGYGLCSMAVVGLKSTTAMLVVPRTDDCIAIFLGSCAAYKAQARKEPGTYYLTKGWIESGGSPFEEYYRLAKQYGESKAKRIVSLMLKNYTRLGFINTGHDEAERYRQYARNMAEQFSLRFEEIIGSPALLNKIVSGTWDDEFVVVQPGQTIQYEHFFPSAYHESKAQRLGFL